MQQKKKTTKNYMDILGEIIESYRLKNKKSIYLISAESNVAKSSWRELEKGKRSNMTLITFCKIAEGLEIPPHKLLKELTDKLGKDFSFTDLDI